MKHFVLVVLFIIFSFKTYGNPGRFSDFYRQSGPNKNLDVNNDGKIDLTVKKIPKKGLVTIITQTPSWNKKIKTVSKIKPDQIKKEVFLNNKLTEKQLIKRNGFDGQRYISKTVYQNYNRKKPFKKLFIDFGTKKNYKLIHHYKKFKSKWRLVKKTEEKIGVVFNSSSELGGSTPISTPIKMSKPNYINTHMGLRIDNSENSCSPKQVSDIKKAIDHMLDVQLDCISKTRPDLSSEIIENLLTNRTVLNCQNEQDAIAYTQSEPDAPISLTDSYFDNLPTSAERAHVLFHEILHHHLPAGHNHNARTNPNDAIFGCSSLCSGLINADINKISPEILGDMSVEGCKKCFNTPTFLDQPLLEKKGSFYFLKFRPKYENEQYCEKNPSLILIDQCRRELGANGIYCSSAIGLFINRKQELLQCLNDLQKSKYCLHERFLNTYLNKKSSVITCMNDLQGDPSCFDTKKLAYIVKNRQKVLTCTNTGQTLIKCLKP